MSSLAIIFVMKSTAQSAGQVDPLQLIQVCQDAFHEPFHIRYGEDMTDALQPQTLSVWDHLRKFSAMLDGNNLIRRAMNDLCR